MKKKSQYSSGWIVIIVILLMTFLFWRIDDIQEKAILECEQQCIEFNAKYHKYETGGFGPDECWCKRDGEPLRVS